MSTITFDLSAGWIWSSHARRPYNNYVCFRRQIEVAGAVQAARLLITADARYELFVNGEWVGQGPVRSWPSPWPVDEYDLQPWLVSGQNVIAVQVQQIGTSTFQYLLGDAGLLAQAEWHDARGQRKVVTDKSWRCEPNEAFAWPAPRITCQQGWEEQYDARRQPGHEHDWRAAEFDDSSWPPAQVVRPAGKGAHAEFESRDIPMLSRRPVEPACLVSAEAVRPAPYVWHLMPREFVNPLDRTMNYYEARMLLATHIYSPRPQDAQIYRPHLSAEWKLNGQTLAFDDRTLQKTLSGVSSVKLRQGWNTLMCRLPESGHFLWAMIAMWTDAPVEFRAEPDLDDANEQPWLAVGPFGGEFTRGGWIQRQVISAMDVHPEATLECYQRIWDRGELTESDLFAPYTRAMASDMVARVDVTAIGFSDRPVKGAAVAVEEPAAMLQDSAEWTTVHPPADGTDARLLLDFGDEVIGYQEFEIDAPAGTVVDFVNFELIQRDGRFNLSEDMNNSFRYTCRAGVQRYRTFTRRGFRYSWMILRNLTGPVRIRNVRVLMNVYPANRQGDFACSDKMLERIWQVGAHSVRCCSEDTFTDCPSYEQTFWVGDARNEALVHLVAEGDARLSKRCLLLAGRSLQRSPIVESHVPSGWENILPAWTFLWMRWAHEHYLLTGDREVAGWMVEILDRNFRGIKQFINRQGLFEIVAWNMFDWAPMDTPSEGVVTHQNCLAVLGLRQSAELARMIGRGGEARRWNALADSLTRAINKHLWSSGKKAYYDCLHADGQPSKVFSQQTQTAAYISGVASGERARRCRGIMEKAPNGFVKAGSPFFMFFALEGMVREGRFDVMLDTIRGYWGRQIEAGATTFWEMYYENQERLTRSHCHGWSAAPTFFLSQHVLGIQPLEPGYRKVRIAPQTGDLAWAKGRVPTPHGIVECRWEKSKKGLTVTVSLPPGVPAVIELPRAGKLSVMEGKVMKLASPRGKTCLAAAGEKIVLSVGM